MTATMRKYYKRSRKLLLTRYKKLQDESKRACDLMLLYNDDLGQNPKCSIQRKEFWEWIQEAERSGLKEFEKCAATYRNWSKEILNAFKYGITNPTEGFNNRIKVLKSTSYGIRNFERFRTRILHCTR